MKLNLELKKGDEAGLLVLVGVLAVAGIASVFGANSSDVFFGCLGLVIVGCLLAMAVAFGGCFSGSLRQRGRTFFVWSVIGICVLLAGSIGVAYSAWIGRYDGWDLTIFLSTLVAVALASALVPWPRSWS